MAEHTHLISVTDMYSGEVIEFAYKDPDSLAVIYKQVESRLNAYKQLKAIILDTGMQLLMKKASKN